MFVPWESRKELRKRVGKKVFEEIVTENSLNLEGGNIQIQD